MSTLITRVNMQVSELTFSASSQRLDCIEVGISMRHVPRPGPVDALVEHRIDGRVLARGVRDMTAPAGFLPVPLSAAGGIPSPPRSVPVRAAAIRCG